MPLHNDKLPYNGTYINVQENAVFIPEFSTHTKKIPPPTHPPPPFGRFAPSLWPPVDKSCMHGYITITGIAKGHKGPCPAPIDWSIRNF